MGSSFVQVKGHRYLFWRNEWLYFRRAIPRDVRHVFGEKPEQQVSLRTMSVAEARHLLSVELARFEKTVADARGVVAPAEIATRRPSPPSLEEIEMGVREWFMERMARAHTDYGAPEAIGEGRSQLDGLAAKPQT